MNYLLLAITTLTFLSFDCFSSTDYDSGVSSFRKTLEKLVEANTTNPPGNEARAVKIVAERLKAAGIPYEISEFAPGRENIVARLKGDGTLKPLMLLAHLDVVGAENQPWTSDPHKVTEKEGYLVGRGVDDDLGMAVMELETFIMIKKSGIPLKRDLILAFTGDEESGGDGIQFQLKKNPESVDAVSVLNEGGGVVLGEDGKVKHIALNVAEKAYQDFLLVAKGPTGHSSVPLNGNAIGRLAAAVDKISNYKHPAKLMDVIRGYFSAKATQEKEKRLAKAFKDLANSKGPLPTLALALVESNPVEAANVRTTCVATLISGGTRANALPSEATANINCRILPTESVDEVKARLAKVINDKEIEIKILEDFKRAQPSSLTGEVPEAVQKVADKMFTGVKVIPFMSRGASDSRFLRAKGVNSYGISPIPMTEFDSRRAHGIDERIPISSLRPGLEFMHRLVLELAAK